MPKGKKYNIAHLLKTTKELEKKVAKALKTQVISDNQMEKLWKKQVQLWKKTEFDNFAKAARKLHRNNLENIEFNEKHEGDMKKLFVEGEKREVAKAFKQMDDDFKKRGRQPYAGLNPPPKPIKRKRKRNRSTSSSQFGHINGRMRKIHFGSRGGAYYNTNGRKVYIN